MKPHARAARPAGIALMLSLVVVVLLTAFISEFFFSTGLELRSMQTFKDATQARNLAKLAFKAVQVGLLNDEVEFFATHRLLEAALNSGGAINWQEGLLLELRIEPQDGLFNLNELRNLRDNSDKDRVRWEMFRNTLKDISVRSEDTALDKEPLPESTVADLYAALVDWIDGGGNVDYAGASGGTGAEAATYQVADPEIRIKDGQLDRLSEIRLVRGVVESGIPWEDWRRNFAVLDKSTKLDLYPEKLNVNLATHEEIIIFLERRRFIADLEVAENDDSQEKLNAYADRAEEIADLLAPETGSRETLDVLSLDRLMKSLGGSINSKFARKIFSLKNEYYRIGLTTAMNEVDAHLEALVRVSRDAARVGSSAQVLYISLK